MPIDRLEPLLSELSKGGRAAYPYLRGLALQEPALTKNAIISQLQSQGFSLRRQTALDLIDLTRNKADLSQFFRTFGENAIIPNSLHKLSPVTFSGGAKVQYLVGTNSANPLIPEAIYVNAPAGLSANQIYGAAIASFRYEEGSGMAVDDLSQVTFTIDDARYNPSGTAEEGFSDDTEYSAE